MAVHASSTTEASSGQHEGHTAGVPEGKCQLEVVGEITGGLLASAWSPGEDELALVSAAGKLLLMTSDWEPITEVDLLQTCGTPRQSFASVPFPKQTGLP